MWEFGWCRPKLYICPLGRLHRGTVDGRYCRTDAMERPPSRLQQCILARSCWSQRLYNNTKTPWQKPYNKVCRLHKALYHMLESLRLWYDLLPHEQIDSGLKLFQTASSVLAGHGLPILCNVDDHFIMGYDEKKFQKLRFLLTLN